MKLTVVQCFFQAGQWHCSLLDCQQCSKIRNLQKLRLPTYQPLNRSLSWFFSIAECFTTNVNSKDRCFPLRVTRDTGCDTTTLTGLWVVLTRPGWSAWVAFDGALGRFGRAAWLLLMVEVLQEYGMGQSIGSSRKMISVGWNEMTYKRLYWKATSGKVADTKRKGNKKSSGKPSLGSGMIAKSAGTPSAGLISCGFKIRNGHPEMTGKWWSFIPKSFKAKNINLKCPDLHWWRLFQWYLTCLFHRVSSWWIRL